MVDFDLNKSSAEGTTGVGQHFPAVSTGLAKRSHFIIPQHFASESYFNHAPSGMGNPEPKSTSRDEVSCCRAANNTVSSADK